MLELSSSNGLFFSEIFCRGLNCAYDLIVARAAAEIPRQGKSNFLIGRIRISVQQGLAGYQKPRCADTALQRCMFDKVGLQWMLSITVCQTLYGVHFPALGLDTQHETGTDQTAV